MCGKNNLQKFARFLNIENSVSVLEYLNLQYILAYLLLKYTILVTLRSW